MALTNETEKKIHEAVDQTVARFLKALVEVGVHPDVIKEAVDLMIAEVQGDDA